MQVVGICAAEYPVVILAAKDLIGAIETIDGVGASIAKKGVIAGWRPDVGAADKAVIGIETVICRAGEPVAEAAAGEFVIAAKTSDVIVAAIADQNIFDVISIQRIVAIASADPVFSSASENRVVATVAVDKLTVGLVENNDDVVPIAGVNSGTDIAHRYVFVSIRETWARLRHGHSP